MNEPNNASPVLLRSRSNRFAELTGNPIFHFIILALIFGAALIIGIDTNPVIHSHFGELLDVMLMTIVGLFFVEQIIRFGAADWKLVVYLRDPWNVFDLLIILFCLLPVGSTTLAIIRLIRVLEVLRLIRVFEKLRYIITGMLHSISSIGSIFLLMLGHFYIFGIIGVTYFGQIDRAHFGTLWVTMVTMFQLITLEGWPDVMAPVRSIHPVAGPLYFIFFIVIGTMIILNFLVGIIVGETTSTFDELRRKNERSRARMSAPNASLVTRMQVIEQQLDQIKESLSAMREEQENAPENRSGYEK